jgi:hypothetical protein
MLTLASGLILHWPVSRFIASHTGFRPSPPHNQPQREDVVMVPPMHPTQRDDPTGVGSSLRSCWASSLSIRPYEGDNALPPQWQSATGQSGCFPGWPLLVSLAPAPTIYSRQRWSVIARATSHHWPQHPRPKTHTQTRVSDQEASFHGIHAGYKFTVGLWGV